MYASIDYLQRNGRLKVSRVSQGHGPEGLDTALFEVAENGRKQWTLEEWEAVLSELDNSKLTVKQWLAKRGH